MSQTETLMVLILGAVLTLICVLFFARLIWNIGQRVARRRSEKAKPALIRDLESDRDQLRASHAMMSQRMTSGLAEAKARVTEQQAEVSRHRNRVLGMTATINSQSDEIVSLSNTMRDLQDHSAAQAADIDQRAELIAQLRGEAEAREDDIQMLKSELHRTANLLEESKQQLQRLEAERADAVERNTLEREAHAHAIAERDALQRDWTTSQRLPPLASDPDVVMVKPSGSTEPQRQYGFERADDGLTLPPVPQHPVRSSDLANLMQNARRTMMERQAEQRKPEAEGARSRAIANVVSLAQKIRSERDE